MPLDENIPCILTQNNKSYFFWFNLYDERQSFGLYYIVSEDESPKLYQLHSAYPVDGNAISYEEFIALEGCTQVVAANIESELQIIAENIAESFNIIMDELSYVDPQYVNVTEKAKYSW